MLHCDRGANSMVQNKLMRNLSGSRQAIIAAIVGTALTVAFFLFLKHEEDQQIRQNLATEAFNIQREVRQNLIAHVFMAEWVARDWSNSDKPLEQRWKKETDTIALYYQSVRNMVWLSPKLQVQLVAPEQGNYSKLNTTFNQSPLVSVLLDSEDNSHAMVGPAGSLAEQKTDIAMFVRVNNAERPGFFGTIISLQQLFNSIVRTNITEGYQLVITDQGNTLYEFQGEQTQRASWSTSTSLQVLGNAWKLELWPTTQRLSELRSGVPVVALLAGLVATGLLTFVFYVLGMSRFRAQELADTNLDLYAEIEERERVEKKMAYLAEHDGLTDLANRNALMRFLEKYCSQSAISDELLVVFFIDLDRFKEVNDALGHTVGDDLLKRVARRLSKIIPEEGYLARTGGDEFVLAIPHMEDREAVEGLANQLLIALDTHFFVDAYEIFISGSIGIAYANDAGFSAETLIRNADTALYRAKENGRNTFRIYTKDLHHDLTEKLEMLKRLRHAIEQEKLVVFYQPKIDFNSRRIIGMEALVRWIEDDGTLIGPDQFIPIAEDTGLIMPISDFVMRSALAQLHEWRELGFTDLTMAINVSGKQLHSPDLVDNVLDAIRRAKVPANRLELELTEQVFIENIQSHTNFMHSIREHGIALAIDDFGVGYSSLAYLKNFPVTSLKIDRSFIQDLPGDKDDATITQTIINLAKNLDINIVAEGIETEEQVDFLLERDCNIGQGFLFSRPLPAEEITRLLEQYQGLIPIQIA